MTLLWLLLHPRAAARKAAHILDAFESEGNWRDVEAGFCWLAGLAALYLGIWAALKVIP